MYGGTEDFVCMVGGYIDIKWVKEGCIRRGRKSEVILKSFICLKLNKTKSRGK